MRLGELLTAAHVHVPLEVGSAAEALLRLLPPDAGMGNDVTGAEALLRRLRAGEGGVARRASPQVVLFSLRGGETDVPWASLGVAPQPIPGLWADEAEEGEPQWVVVVVLRLPRIPELGTGATEAVLGALKIPAVRSGLLEADSPEAVLAIESLLGPDMAQPLRVRHVFTPLQYRVFRDAPLSEALELMARRELRSLPVVGEDLEVLGVLSGAEALRLALEQVGQGVPPTKGLAEVSVGDVMSRTVMCVSEDQDLLDAANVMVKRAVSQLPVVKEGEVIGVLSRDAVLRAVLGTG